MSAPVSEQNAPVGRTIGFKPWSPGVERWWQGSQWSETYRAVEIEEEPEDDGGMGWSTY